MSNNKLEQKFLSIFKSSFYLIVKQYNSGYLQVECLNHGKIQLYILVYFSLITDEKPIGEQTKKTQAFI